MLMKFLTDLALILGGGGTYALWVLATTVPPKVRRLPAITERSRVIFNELRSLEAG